VCADLEQADVTYMRLSDDPEIDRSYREWSAGRREFHEKKARGEVKPGDWQKDYFTGRDASGREAAPEHMTKVTPPQSSGGRRRGGHIRPIRSYNSRPYSCGPR
jgi:hypothetical protein